MVETLRWIHIVLWGAVVLATSLSLLRNLAGRGHGRDRTRGAVCFTAIAFTAAGIRALFYAPSQADISADAAAAWVGMYVLTIVAAPLLFGATWVDEDA